MRGRPLATGPVLTALARQTLARSFWSMHSTMQNENMFYMYIVEFLSSYM